MNIVLWGKSIYQKEMEAIRNGLNVLQKEQSFCPSDICICTGTFESYYGKEFANAELLFVYFQTAGEEFCRFLIAHRRYTEKTVFLFGQSYGCFDAKKWRTITGFPKRSTCRSQSLEIIFLRLV